MSGDEDDDRQRTDAKGVLHPEGMRAVRELAAGVVHEVNNILGVIIGNAHLAKKNLSDPDAIEKYVGELRDAAEEGREIMRDLSILAAAESFRERALSLNDLAQSGVSAITTPVKLDLSAKDPPVRLDIWLAQDALSCVAAFMAATQAVTSLRVATRIIGPVAELAFEDDGPTPTEEELRRIFTPFAKIRRRPKTTLALTKLADLAARFGGRVRAAAVQPNGLSVVLSLPMASDATLGDGPRVSLPQKGV